jgi:lysophospholipid acyltransferase (LPLAT)-like uncharacterized protein
MKLRSPWLIRLFAFLAAVVIRLWMRTVRYRLVFPPGMSLYPVDARVTRFLYAFWHETILFPTVFVGRVKILISKHADGELIAQVCQRLGYGVVRGSSTRGGTQALLQLCRACEGNHLLVTPDGPRGPRRQVQPGLVFLASRTGLPVVACGVGCSRVWRAKSWDRFAVPWPFSQAVVVVAPPVQVPADLDRVSLEYYRQVIEEGFLAATRAAEQLAEGRPAPPPAQPPAETLPLKASA